MKNILRLSLILLLSISMILAAAACSKPADKGEKKDEGAPAQDQKADDKGDKQEASGDAEYCVILKVLSSNFWQSMKQGVEDEAKKLGVKVDIFAANSEDDVEGQVTLLENAINKGYKGIAIAPISSDNLNRAAAEATKKGIYIFNLDERLNLKGLEALGGRICGFVATNNKEVGKMGAEYIVDQIKEGQVAIIEGKAGAASGEDRKEGATEGFKKDGIELVASQPADWDRTKAYDLATNYINKYPDLKGIYCCNDTMAMGALEAVKNSGKNILVVGTDGNEDAIASVKAGELAATVAQNPAGIGARGLELMVEAVKKGEPIDQIKPVDESVAAILITKENAK